MLNIAKFFSMFIVLVKSNDVPAESMMDHEIETGVCKGTTLTVCPDFSSPEACLLMGCSAIFPPHTLPTHRDMCFCADEMKDCSDFETNYECEFLAGCDWEYDFVFGSDSHSVSDPDSEDCSRGLDFGSSDQPTSSPDGSRGLDFGSSDQPTSSPDGSRGLDFGSSETFFTFQPTSSPDGSRGLDFGSSDSPSYAPTSSPSYPSVVSDSDNTRSVSSESNSSVSKFSGLTFVLFLIPCFSFLF